MYIFKNALKSITRTKVRNILIGIIITIIALSSCIALSIKNSAVKLIESYENSYEVEAQLSLNRESMRKDATSQKAASSVTASDFMANIPQLTVDLVNTYGTSDYVKSYSYYIQTEMNSSNIEKATSEETTTTNQGGMGRLGGMQQETSKVSGDFKIVGYSSLDTMSEFVNSEYKITSGQIFDINATDNPCAISTDLADQNDLTVGSTLTMINPNNEAETYEFKIVGIYEDTSESEEFSMFSNAANQILTNYNSLNNIIKTSEVTDDTKLVAQINATFVLNNQDVIDDFSSELTTKGLSSYYTVTTNVETLNSAIEPIQNLSNFANIFLIIVLAIGGVILVVINMINIRERKYEIGVLRAIGMKKYKVLQQFVIELFIVTIISLVIGTTVGAFLTVPIANNMLASEIASQTESQNEVNSNFGGGGPQMGAGRNGDIRNTFSSTSDVEYIDKINAVINTETILQLLGIGILLTIISSSISMISISRYRPLKILNNRT
jgi:putative ABC transport system permease protein